MNSIPASQLVDVTPGVLGAGGSPLSLNSVFFTRDGSIPIGAAYPFATLDDVKAWFGSTSVEASFAAVYSGRFIGATSGPGTLYFAQFNEANVAGYLRGGSVAALTLAQLQGFSGSLIVDVNGETVTSANIDLSAATSFTNAAALMTAGLQVATGIFSGTAHQTAAAAILDVTAVASGKLHVGDVLHGAGVDVGLTIVNQLTGAAGGIGTYTVSTTTGFVATAVTVAGIGTCTYNAQLNEFVITSPTTGADSSVGFASGTLAASVKLTQVTGAVLSAGAVSTTFGAALDSVTRVTQNWAAFTTTWEPTLDGKLAAAAWVNASGERYAYVGWDSDVTALAPDAAGSFGVLTANYDGVIPVWNPDGLIAAFICGTIASVNYDEKNGKITFAYRGQPGLQADVTDATIARNLDANGYNFYGSYATANQQFTFLQPGKISGQWKWIDPYVNQIKLNSDFQLAFMSFLSTVKSAPYNQQGYNEIRAAAFDPINAALNFGSIQSGVTLSAAQQAEINIAAGGVIAPTISQTGWYLQILDAAPLTRGQRGSPPMTFWYTDGGSIQKINLASIDIE